MHASIDGKNNWYEFFFSQFSFFFISGMRHLISYADICIRIVIIPFQTLRYPMTFKIDVETLATYVYNESRLTHFRLSLQYRSADILRGRAAVITRYRFRLRNRHRSSIQKFRYCHVSLFLWVAVPDWPRTLLTWTHLALRQAKKKQKKNATIYVSDVAEASGNIRPQSYSSRL